MVPMDTKVRSGRVLNLAIGAVLALFAAGCAGRPAPTPPEDAVGNQKVLDALFASERSGGWVQV